MSLNLGHESSRMGSPARYGAAGNSGSVREEKSLGSPQPVRRTPAELRKWKAVSRTWTARRSTGSPLGVLSPMSQSPVDGMRRSMSFEWVATSYLSRECPRTCNLHNNRLNLLRCHVILTTDKWTQTSEDIDNQDSGTSKFCVHSKLPFSCLENTDKVHIFREREMASGILRASTTHCDRSGIQTIFDRAVQGRAIAARNACQRNLVTINQTSAEEFNQEVEKLVENTGIIDSDEGEMQSIHMQTPDGHRAPVAELLSMGCQNVPRMLSVTSLISDVENHFVRIPEDIGSGSPSLSVIPDPFSSSSAPVSHLQSTEKTSDMCQQPSNVIVSPSPVVHKLLRKRQAPVGSELENGMLTDFRANVRNNSSSPVKTSNSSRFNIPSEHSAFYPLLKKYVSKKCFLMFSVSSGAAAEAQ